MKKNKKIRYPKKNSKGYVVGNIMVWMPSEKNPHMGGFQSVAWFTKYGEIVWYDQMFAKVTNHQLDLISIWAGKQKFLIGYIAYLGNYYPIGRNDNP